MDIEMLMNELDAQDVMEKDINSVMRKEVDDANELIEDIKDGWMDFVRDAFPERIIKMIGRFPTNGVLSIKRTESCADDIQSRISVGDLHIAYYKDSSRTQLIFVQGKKTIGFRVYLSDYEKTVHKKLVSWDDYPVTFWKNLPYKINFYSSKENMEKTRETIDLVYEFNQMLADFQNHISDIYTEIAKANEKYVRAKRELLAKETPVEEPKKYKITIEVEEI